MESVMAKRMTHEYWCLYGEIPAHVEERKTKPKIGQICTMQGKKWHVWYVEELPGQQGPLCRARLEPYGWGIK